MQTTEHETRGVTGVGATNAELQRASPSDALRSNIERAFDVNANQVDPGSKSPEAGMIPQQFKHAGALAALRALGLEKHALSATTGIKGVRSLAPRVTSPLKKPAPIKPPMGPAQTNAQSAFQVDLGRSQGSAAKAVGTTP